MRAMKVMIFVGIMVLVASQLAMAVITFTQLDDDLFIVSHQIKGLFGQRAKAMKLVYTKAASLCVAAGFTHLKIMDQESEAGGQHDSPNASIRVRCFFEDGEERIDCKKKASEKYIEQAAIKLKKEGYQRPDPAASTPAESTAEIESCTVEQISAMVKAGLSTEQVKAACKQSAVVASNDSPSPSS